ncbi:MAG: PIG-L family deacetylase [Lachnospiraceae bacterium]|nr:PIG-L family deacetylase [Lachnospiraceae bacterium]
MLRKLLGKLPRAVRIAIIAVLAAAAAFFALVYVCNKPYLRIPKVTTEQLDEIDLEHCYNLMIVAHPDDDYLWGGAHLLSGDWFVVVLTNKDNKVRSAEFAEMTAALGNKGMILGYPDKIARRRSDWSYWEDDIREDIKTILSYKDWNMVVTHNADGEYGHQHHKATHRLTVEAFDAIGCGSDLYFFGRYYKKGEVPTNRELDSYTINQKLQYVDIYLSQSKTICKLAHMLAYENWEKR